MASPAVTYTFSNGTTADATQVNQNFTDLINSLTDATKSLSIDALTVAGSATLNGAVTLGNATADDITFTGSLASSIPIKTTDLYDIGSATLGLAGVYFGDNSQTVRIIASASASATYTFTLPPAAGSAGDYLENTGSGTMAFSPIRRNSDTLQNIAVACSVGSSALTIALKGHDGNDLSATNRAYVGFRSATAATGTPVTRTLSAAASLVIPSTATMGHADATEHFMYVYLMDNAGTVVLAASSVQFDEGTINSSTAVSTGADDSGVLYSSSGLSNKSIRLIARLRSTQTTAGTWAAVPTEIAPPPFDKGDIMARYEMDGTEANLVTSTTTFLDFGTKIYDTHNMVTGAGNDHNTTYTNTFRAVTPKDGIYLINVNVICDSNTGWGAGERLHVYVTVDGVQKSVITKDEVQSADGGGIYMQAVGSAELQLTKGQAVSVDFFHQVGADLSLSSGNEASFTMRKVGELP